MKEFARAQGIVFTKIANAKERLFFLEPIVSFFGSSEERYQVVPNVGYAVLETWVETTEMSQVRIGSII
jgi:hypothetical protein